MKKTHLILLLSLILLPFGAGYAVLRVNISQLKLFLEKKKVYNYELSNQLLKERFHFLLEEQYRDDNRREVHLRVLESHIISEKENGPGVFSRISALERFAGLPAVNSTRILLGKNAIDPEEDYRILQLLNRAFYLERNKDFISAVKLYELLEQKIRSDDNQRAFILLHSGYCLALSNSSGKALSQLRTVQEEFPGTSYELTAGVLIELIKENSRQNKEILRLHSKPIARARAYYRKGLYPRAISNYNRIKKLSELDQYQLARSHEESGGIEKALKVYVKLLQSSKSSSLAKKSNRRLLLYTTFTPGQKKYKKILESQAIRLNDKKFTKFLTKNSSYYRSSRIEKKIRNAPETKAGEPLAFLKKSAPISSQQEGRFMIITLEDGRVLSSTAITRRGNLLSVRQNKFDINFQPGLVKTITGERGKTLKIRLKKGKTLEGQALRQKQDHFMIQNQKSVGFDLDQLISIKLK